MKKLRIALCCTLALCLGLSSLAEEATNATWKLDYYLDEFKLPTDKAYITNADPIDGTFCDSEVDDAPLSVSVFVDERNISFQLFENGSSKVKNSDGRDRLYNVTMLDDARQKTSMLGGMNANGGDRLYLEPDDAQIVYAALTENAALSFYIEEAENSGTNYLFTVDTAGFNAGLDDLLNSFRERDYQQAVELYNSGDYKAALAAFIELGDYKDSADWLPKYREMKYGEAEALLAEGKYAEANDAFIEAGDYSDAASRVGEPYYAQAEALLAAGDYDGAIEAFNKADDYGDAKERAEELNDVQIGELLQQVGLLNTSDANGAYDNQVQEALRLFQSWINQLRGEKTLDITGIADPLTMRYLRYCVEHHRTYDPLLDSSEPEATASGEPTLEPTIVPYGQPCTLQTQIKADGSERAEATDEPFETLSLTIQVDAYKDPTYFQEQYAYQYMLQGDEAAVQFDITLNNYTGTTKIIPQNFLLFTFAGEDPEVTNQGYQLMDAEIAGKTEVAITSDVTTTLYKRYSRTDGQGDMVYMVVTAYNDGMESVYWFEILPPEPAEESAAGTITGLEFTISGQIVSGTAELIPGEHEINWAAQGGVQSYSVYLFDGYGNQLQGVDNSEMTGFSISTNVMTPGEVYELRVGALPTNGTSDDIYWQSLYLTVPVAESPEPTEAPPTASSVSAPVISIGGASYQQDGVTYISDSTVTFTWTAGGPVESYTVNLSYEDGTSYSLGTITDTSRSVNIDQLQPGLYHLYVGATPVGGDEDSTVWSELVFGIPESTQAAEQEIRYVDANSSAEDIQTVQMALYRYGLLDAQSVQAGALDSVTLEAVAAFQQLANDVMGVGLSVIDPAVDQYVDRQTLELLLYRELDLSD